MRALVAITLILAIACGKKEQPSAAPTGPTIQIAIDDADPAPLVLTTTRPLAAVVGPQPAAWVLVTASTPDGRDLELTRPSTKYPDAEVRLYLDQERPAIGVFRRITADMPPDIASIARQPVVSLVGITEVEVRTRIEEMPPLALRVDGRDHAIAESLRALKRHPTRKPRERGWELGAIIALVIPPERSVTTLRLHTKTGVPTTIDAKLLADPAAVLKRNRHGAYVFRMWDKTPAIEVRDVTLIEVE